MFVIYSMSTVQFVFQALINGEVFYDVATNDLQILREREIKWLRAWGPVIRDAHANTNGANFN